MNHRGPARTEEGTARFIFQAALGIGSFCIMAAMILGLRDVQIGAGIFLLLALIGLGAAFYYGRVYVRLRQRRWDQELARPQEALDQLFARARAEQDAPPRPQDSDGA